MTNKQFLACYEEIQNYKDRDAYVSDMCLSSIWGAAADADIPEERITALGDIWDAAHRSVKEIAAAAGMSQRKLAERFCIPYRTMDDWCRGVRTPPDHVRLMMQECLGILKR